MSTPILKNFSYNQKVYTAELKETSVHTYIFL